VLHLTRLWAPSQEPVSDELAKEFGTVTWTGELGQPRGVVAGSRDEPHAPVDEAAMIASDSAARAACPRAVMGLLP